MNDVMLIIKDEYGKKFYEIHESDEIFDYTLNKVLKTNFEELFKGIRALSPPKS